VEREFEFVDEVTSDLAFVARGATLADLFRNAAEALLAATLEDPAQVSQRVRRSVHLEEPDLELLLLQLATEVKAVTAHGLRVAQEAGDGGGSWEASVTLDV
jgi:SHS2 domain-containing protein